jgi:hypothetical protein
VVREKIAHGPKSQKSRGNYLIFSHLSP